MSLTAGARLGPYEILESIGAGGMGVVYRARDTRLDRIVAVKVLAAGTAKRPEFRQRFEREARAVSALNHPHICTLHDVGSVGDIDYIVMEYLEGETLAARLRSGALPLDQALRIALESADALDRAHRTGIIHRDLKPGNIMLTKGGAKLLDFGLARLRDPAGDGPSPAGVLTGTQTMPGLIMGTLPYMAPEQLEAREVDARADIFAFGAVLYEMLTGRRPFEGRSQASLIGAILDRDPPLVTSLQPTTPPLLAAAPWARMALLSIVPVAPAVGPPPA
jgi:serine/threonine protein kinase